MPAPTRQKVAALCGDGHIRLMEQDLPELRSGAVLVAVHASLVSPGTELGGWASLAQKRDSPDPDAEPRQFGYSNAGVVVEAGQGVTEFRPGDRVACVGGGYALHADWAVVPHHLCVALPDNVTFDQGAYAMLSATALQAVRRGEPELGENVGVVGLGIVGQLTARLYQLAGCYVIGWDTLAPRIEIAKAWGIDAAVHLGAEDPVAATEAFTNARGLDAAVLAFGGDGEAAYESVVSCLKETPDGHRMGRIVVVGGAKFNVRWCAGNFDVRIAARTGPGYHDEAWEFGPDYPPVFLRWTTRTNLELCMRWIAEGKLDVNALTTHTIPLDNVDEGVSEIIAEPDSILGVVFHMKSE